DDKLLAWLKDHQQEASAAPAEELTSTEALTDASVTRLVGELTKRDPALREAAVRRLLPHPDLAATPVVEAFTKGNLQTKLAAFALLNPRKAPDTDLDPCRPEPVTEARLKALSQWAATPPKAPESATPAPLAPADLATAKQEIARLVQGSPTEASAIRER